eukprot:4838742-Lingulodinium_polyedra.AAC.1
MVAWARGLALVPRPMKAFGGQLRELGAGGQLAGRGLLRRPGVRPGARRVEALRLRGPGVGR